MRPWSGGRADPVGARPRRYARSAVAPRETPSAPIRKVLIIEDYYALADIESLLCTMEGHEVRVAKTGDEGLTAVAEFNPDLILLDLMLPGELTGTQVLERIRAERGQEPKVLVVSALVNPATTAQLEAFGNVQTLAKPFKIKDLSGRIQAMLTQ